MQFENVARTHTGLVRDVNQDSVMSLPDHGVFMVADGMGGEQAGDEASAQVVATARAAVETFFKNAPSSPNKIESILHDTLMQANHDVYQISVREPSKRGLGSTASMLCLYRGVYFIAQVGDSRIYLLRNGKFQLLTRDHTLVWALYEQGSITREQLESHPDRHLLTQCIGSDQPVKIDTLENSVEEGDLFLLCSDGLTGYAGENAVFETLHNSSESLEQRADRLIEAALAGGGGDNVSLILVRVNKLDRGDDWKPEDTAPLSRLDPAQIDTLIGEDGERKSTARKLRRNVRGIAIAAAILVLLTMVLVSALRPQPVRIYLEPQAQLPDEFAIEATKGGKSLSSPKVQQDERGHFVELPGPGEYRLKFVSHGYSVYDRPLTVSKDETVGQTDDNWLQLAKLILELPTGASANRLTVSAVDDRMKYHEVESWKAEELAGREKLELFIRPNLMHTVIAEADGHQKFTVRLDEPPGASRTIRVHFERLDSKSDHRNPIAETRSPLSEKRAP